MFFTKPTIDGVIAGFAKQVETLRSLASDHQARGNAERANALLATQRASDHADESRRALTIADKIAGLIDG